MTKKNRMVQERGSSLMEESRIKLEEKVTMENLWRLIEEHQGEMFYTARKLPFTYTVKGGELFTERKKKSITRSTFEKAYQKVLDDPKGITGPKKLNVFGGPYVWAIFLAFGIVG